MSFAAERVRFGVIGAGRVGQLHTENLAHYIPRERRSWSLPTSTQRLHGRRRRVLAFRRPASMPRKSLPVTRSTPLPSVPARRRTRRLSSRRHELASMFSAKSQSRWICPRSIGHWRRWPRAASNCRSVSTGALIPTSAACAMRCEAARWGQALPGADHQPRPGPTAAWIRRRLGRPVSRHDDPRLRHGPLPARRRNRGGHGARGGCALTSRSARRATSIRQS